MNTDDIPQSEKRRIMQASNYLNQYQSEIGGRFSATQTEIVTGRVSPKVPPLPASSPWSGAQPEPGEEPGLGYPIGVVERD